VVSVWAVIVLRMPLMYGPRSLCRVVSRSISSTCATDNPCRHRDRQEATICCGVASSSRAVWQLVRVRCQQRTCERRVCGAILITVICCWTAIGCPFVSGPCAQIGLRPGRVRESTLLKGVRASRQMAPLVAIANFPHVLAQNTVARRCCCEAGFANALRIAKSMCPDHFQLRLNAEKRSKGRAAKVAHRGSVRLVHADGHASFVLVADIPARPARSALPNGGRINPRASGSNTPISGTPASGRVDIYIIATESAQLCL